MLVQFLKNPKIMRNHLYTRSSYFNPTLVICPKDEQVISQPWISSKVHRQILCNNFKNLYPEQSPALKKGIDQRFSGIGAVWETSLVCPWVRTLASVVPQNFIPLPLTVGVPWSKLSASGTLPSQLTRSLTVAIPENTGQSGGNTTKAWNPWVFSVPS